MHIYPSWMTLKSLLTYYQIWRMINHDLQHHSSREADWMIFKNEFRKNEFHMSISWISQSEPCNEQLKLIAYLNRLTYESK